MELRFLERNDWNKSPDGRSEWPKIRVLQYRDNADDEWQDVPMVKD